MSSSDETLADLLRIAQQRFGTRSGRALAERAQKAGHKLTFTTINQILAGTYRSKPSRTTIEAVAELAGVSKTRAIRAAGIPTQQRPFAQDLPPDVELLTPAQREIVINLIRQMVATNTNLETALLTIVDRAPIDTEDALDDVLAAADVPDDRAEMFRTAFRAALDERAGVTGAADRSDLDRPGLDAVRARAARVRAEAEKVESAESSQADRPPDRPGGRSVWERQRQ